MENVTLTQKEQARLQVLNSFHGNFYEDNLNEDVVRGGIDSARELVDDLKVAESRMLKGTARRGRRERGSFESRGL